MTGGPPVYEVEVTRLVTFIVAAEELRLGEYDVGEEGEGWDAQLAAEEFVDGLAGSPVDNYATIHAVEDVPMGHRK